MEHHRSNSPVSLLILGNTDLVKHVVAFLGPCQFRYIASINKTFHKAYTNAFPDDKRTNINVSTGTMASFCFDDGVTALRTASRDDFGDAVANSPLRKIYDLVTKLGNLAVIKYMHSVSRIAICPSICTDATIYGHLDVLKWARQMIFIGINGHVRLLHFMVIWMC